MKITRAKLKISLAVAWLVFTTSMTVWWMYFALNLISQFEFAEGRHKTMLLWEGATLIALLLIGGSTLIYFVLQEKRQSQSLRIFFSGFTHDIKNRIAGIKLQTEILRLDNNNEKLKTLIDRLITDTSRLQVQVENSLYVGGSQDNQTYFENLNLKNLLGLLQDSWPQIQIHLKGEPILRTDRRAFEGIVTNILHNAISHGQATQLVVQAEKLSAEKLRLTFVDNGQGFSGDTKRLGEIFYRHSPASGSGLGLYTCAQSAKRMQGELAFIDSKEVQVKEFLQPGFAVRMDLPGELKVGATPAREASP